MDNEITSFQQWEATADKEMLKCWEDFMLGIERVSDKKEIIDAIDLLLPIFNSGYYYGKLNQLRKNGKKYREFNKAIWVYFAGLVIMYTASYIANKYYFLDLFSEIGLLWK